MKEPNLPPRCEACRRPSWRGPRMTETDITGVGKTLLCDDPKACRQHW